ncbi:MAG: hypothetical protein ABIP51_09830 [Bacteroidia bacterium]
MKKAGIICILIGIINFFWLELVKDNTIHFVVAFFSFALIALGFSFFAFTSSFEKRKKIAKIFFIISVFLLGLYFLFT